MKAIVQSRYGPPDDVLELQEIEKPAAKDDEVLVRVKAASVHPDVWHVVRGLPYVLRVMGAGLRRPKNRVPGTDVAGIVEAVGPLVKRFQPGDAVFGETVRGHQWHNGGAYAEYVAVAEEILAFKPANVSFEQAAAVPTSGLIALQGLRHEGRLQAGQRVLINGAGGGVGLMAVQLAKATGAHVTGVDTAAKLDTMRSAGADRVIDHLREDFTRGSERHDLIVDIPGNHPFSACRRALTPDGTYVHIGHDHFGGMRHRVLGGLPRAVKGVAMARFDRQLPQSGFTMPNKKDAMAILATFLADGKLAPVIDRTYPLREVPAAIHYLEQGNVHGKIVITV